MNVLTTKDLRLSLDVLRPWALLAGGFGVGAVLLTRLPDSLVPASLSRMPLSELLATLALVIGGSAIACAAWLATVVVQGDRLHGAGHLASSLPVPAWRRVVSKLLVVVAASMVPAVATIALHSAAILLEGPSARSTPLEFTLIAVPTASLVGACLALGVTHLIRGTFQTVAIALLVGMVGAVGGAIGGAVGFQFGESDLIDAATQSADTWTLGAVRDRVVWIAALGGVGTVAIACGTIGTLAMLRLRSKRWTLLALVAGCAASILSGFVIAKPAFSSDDRLETWPTYLSVRARGADASELCAGIDRIRRSATLFYVTRVNDFTALNDFIVLNEARLWVGRLSESERERDPVALALRRCEDFSTPAHVERTLLYYVSQQDPRRLVLALDATERFPDSPQVREQLLFDQQFATRWTTHWLADHAGMTEQERMQAFASDRAIILRDTLKTLIAENHPERERMQRVVDALESSGALNAPVPNKSAEAHQP